MTQGSESKAFRLKRLLNIVTFLNNHGEVKAQTLCDLFGLSKSELTATVNEILMCGVPPYSPSDYMMAWIEDGRVAVVNAEFLRRPLSLTMAEAISIRVMIDEFLRQSPGAFQEAAESLAAKLDAVIGRAASPAGAPGALAAKMLVVEQALDESRTVEISYYSRAEDVLARRVIEPRAIVDIDGLWYVVAFCRLRGAERAFRADRIRAARLLDEGFERPGDFDVERYRRREMFFPTGDETPVRVRFGPQSARWAHERFHERLVERCADGGCVCEFPVADTAWIGDLVTEFAGDASIIAPEAVADAFRGRLAAVLALYA